MSNLKDYAPLPTSESELDAQIDDFQSTIDEAVNPKADTGREQDKAQEQSRAGEGSNGPTPPDPEYIAPSDGLTEACGFCVDMIVNPLMRGFGITPLDDDTVKAIGNDIANVAAQYPKLNFVSKMSPKKQAYTALGFTLLTVIGSRIPEAFDNHNKMRDVTPKPDGQPQPQDDGQKSEPLYG